MENLPGDKRFSDYLFWDVDQSKMSPNVYRSFVIRRVFEFGTLDDLIESLSFYGRDTIKETLLSSDSLADNAIDLASALFQLRPTDFQCYTSKPSLTPYGH